MTKDNIKLDQILPLTLSILNFSLASLQKEMDVDSVASNKERLRELVVESEKIAIRITDQVCMCLASRMQKYRHER